jgi:dTDP-glucose 4,6-dehydratase
MIVNALDRKALPVYGDGLNVRDWLYVEDHCEAIRTVLRLGRPGETYNVGGNGEKTNLDVVGTISSVLKQLRPGYDYESLITYVKDRPGHDRRYAINCSKIEKELNWRPRETFETGIRKTIEWYLGNMEWVDNVTSGAYQNWVAVNYAGRG